LQHRDGQVFEPQVFALDGAVGGAFGDQATFGVVTVDGVGDVDLADAFAEAVVLVAGDSGGGGGLGEAALAVVGELAGSIADQAAVGVPAVVLRRGAVDTLQAVAGRVEGVGAGRAAEGVTQTVAGGVPGVAVAGVGQAGAGQAVEAVVAVGRAARGLRGVELGAEAAGGVVAEQPVLVAESVAARTAVLVLIAGVLLAGAVAVALDAAEGVVADVAGDQPRAAVAAGGAVGQADLR
jgi:hypothetical protein